MEFSRGIVPSSFGNGCRAKIHPTLFFLRSEGLQFLHNVAGHHARFFIGSFRADRLIEAHRALRRHQYRFAHFWRFTGDINPVVPHRKVRPELTIARLRKHGRSGHHGYVGPIGAANVRELRFFELSVQRCSQRRTNLRSTLAPEEHRGIRRKHGAGQQRRPLSRRVGAGLWAVGGGGTTAVGAATAAAAGAGRSRLGGGPATTLERDGRGALAADGL